MRANRAAIAVLVCQSKKAFLAELRANVLAGNVSAPAPRCGVVPCVELGTVLAINWLGRAMRCPVPRARRRGQLFFMDSVFQVLT